MTTTAKRQPIKLTTKAVSTLKSQGKKQRDWFDTIVRGLSLRVTDSGKKSWTLQYRIGRRKRRWTIDLADENHGGISLASARKKAKSALTALRDQGIDPADTKVDKRTAATFGDLVDAFLKDRAASKSIAEYERVLNKHFLPIWRHRAAKEISRRDVVEIIDKIAGEAPVAANRSLAYVSAVFTFGVRKCWFDNNPAWKVERREETSRERRLSHDEVRALWTALDDWQLDRDDDDAKPAIRPMEALAMKCLLLTSQRCGEVFSMRWKDIDRDENVWTLPASQTKNGVQHRIPLTDRVIELLDAAKAAAPDEDNRFVFAGRTSGASVADRAKKAMAAVRRARPDLFDPAQLPPTAHDLRRTASTLMEEDGIPLNHIDKVLNHKQPRGVSRVTAVYARHPYDAEKRVALETLARRIDAILAAKPATVVPFAR